MRADYKVKNKFTVTFMYKGCKRDFEIKLESATADVQYQPCVMYFADGSGQPEDWDFDNYDFTVEDIDTNDEYFDGIDLNNLYDTDKEFKKLIDDSVMDYLVDSAVDDWDYADEDDYEWED